MYQTFFLSLLEMKTCYFLLNYAWTHITQSCFSPLCSLLLFSFELCHVAWNKNLPSMRGDGLAIFFWIMLYHTSFEKLFYQIVECLAIFFWIMLHCVQQIGRACYGTWGLLFSFELCGDWRTVYVYRKLLRYLLFSFELCSQSIQHIAGVVGRRTCYFLLNYAQHTAEQQRARNVGDLLFSFELCARKYGFVVLFAKMKACYFLLNYAAVLPRGEQVLPVPACYFLLNYARLRKFHLHQHSSTP